MNNREHLRLTYWLIYNSCLSTHWGQCKETVEQHTMYENSSDIMDYPHILYTTDESE